MIRGPVVPARLARAPVGGAAVAADALSDGAATPTGPLRRPPSREDFARAEGLVHAGGRLPGRWTGRSDFTLLEIGFGCGTRFLAAWAAWRDDPLRPARLEYVAIESHPLGAQDLPRALAAAPDPRLASALAAAWPPAVPGLHALDFEGGRVRLLLAFGAVTQVLPLLRVAADAIVLPGDADAAVDAAGAAADERAGAAAPVDPRVLRTLAHRTRPGATLAAGPASAALRDGLSAAGFRLPDVTPGDRHPTTVVAVLRERFPGARAPTPPGEAVIVGAGLAGAFTARALADLGWAVRVLDRATEPAAGTSGNPGGLFHGTVHADDGPHARWLRAAALLAARVLEPARERGVPGSAAGLLRLGDLPAMQAAIARHGLPPDWVQALDRDAASARAGLPLPGAAWWFPTGGWASPRDWVRDALRGLPFVGGADVERLQRDDASGTWQLVDREGRLIDAAPTVVLANAHGAARLAAPWGLQAPLASLRGQVSAWPALATSLRLPVAGDGYALPLGPASADDSGNADGCAGAGLLCGATQQAGDDDPRHRAADDAHNAERLRRLTGLVPPGPAPASRVGFRLVSGDRLPIAGPVPRADGEGSAGPRRGAPARDGLWICTALGGRGITLAPLLGRLLAARIAGTPWPVEQPLADAVDPARWRRRAKKAR